MRFTFLVKRNALISAICLIGFVHSNSVSNLLERNNGTDVPTISIVGGTAAVAGQFSYIAVLLLDQYLCGGSLIGSSRVLTAAHCVDVITFKVNLNTLSVNDGGSGSLVKGVKKLFKHPSYRLIQSQRTSMRVH